MLLWSNLDWRQAAINAICYLEPWFSVVEYSLRLSCAVAVPKKAQLDQGRLPGGWCVRDELRVGWIGRCDVALRARRRTLWTAGREDGRMQMEDRRGLDGWL